MTWKEEIRKNELERQPISEVIFTIEAELENAGVELSSSNEFPEYMQEPKDITINSNLLNLILMHLKNK